MRAVFSCREDSVDVPREHDSLSGPLSRFGVRPAVSVLLAIGHSPEQEFIISRVGTEVSAISAPVKGSDERVMPVAPGDLLVVIVDVVDVNHVIVRPHGQVFAARRNAHALDPLLRVFQRLLVVLTPADVHLAVIGSNNGNLLLFIVSNCTRALGVRQGGQGRCSFPRILYGLFVDDALAKLSALFCVPDQNLVVIA